MTGQTFPRFRREVIYEGSPAERVACVVGDLDGDGREEIVIASRRPAELIWLGRAGGGAGGGGDWRAHLLDDGFETLEAGGLLHDLTGDGRLDFVGGQDGRGDKLFWWENPGDPDQRWTRRVITTMPANKSHDQLMADLDGDGRAELYYWNQKARTLFVARVPDDPRLSPWPDIQPVATDVEEEGLATADVDGDGREELIAGQSWYKPLGEGRWERHVFAEGFITPRVAAADFDGDGRVEIVLAEGDASLNQRTYGRLALCRQKGDPAALWEAEVLHDRLLDPHSLEVGDFTGDGRPDLFVGELGKPDGHHAHPPAVRVYFNDGGVLRERVIESGIGTHESKLIRLDGRLGIVGKPFRVVRSELPRGPDVDGIHLWRQV